MDGIGLAEGSFRSFLEANTDFLKGTYVFMMAFFF